ncbi:protein toll-like [Ceratitis capitata]|uniref:protein toll-like n=1 Tax=Ceratitis capitata TaxID=7213 RepID=UPI000C6C84D7|nr:protein toll-like [Ceratitis capitata]
MNCWFKSESVNFKFNSDNFFIEIICTDESLDINKSLEKVPKFEMPTRAMFSLRKCLQLPDILKRNDVIYDAVIIAIESMPMSLLHNSSGIESLTVKSYIPISPIFFLHLKSLRSLTFEILVNYLDADRPVYLTTDHFQNLTDLENVTITYTFSNSFPANIFSSLAELQQLSLQNNELSEIQESSFAAQEKLISLDLSRNFLKYLPDKLFENTSSLRYLYLSENYFSNPSIIIACTKPLAYLNGLDLSHNKLRTITGNDSHVNETLLTNFEQLKDFASPLSNKNHSGESERRHFIWLDLSFNPIKIFNTNWYNKMRTKLPIITILPSNKKEYRYLALSLFDARPPYKRQFYYAADPQECYKSLYTVRYMQANILEATGVCRWLPDYGKCEYVWNAAMLYIDCSSRNMTEFTQLTSPSHFGVKYANLDISYNKLSELPEATTIAYLDVIQLNASHNQLTVIRSTQLPSNLGMLDVSNNQMAHLSPALLHRYMLRDQAVTRLFLRGNPWRCDCSAEHLMFAVKAFRSHIFDADQMHCVNEPTRGVLDLTYASICPEKCENLLDNEMLYINCSSRNNAKFALVDGPAHFGAKYAKLDISYNQLRELSAATTIAHLNVTQVNVSHNQLTVIGPTQLPSNLSVLDVRNNQLAHLSTDFLQRYLHKNQSLTRLYLSGNPWRCDCDDEQFMLAVKAFSKRIPDADQLHCVNEPRRRILNLTYADICSIKESIFSPVYIGVSSAAILTLILIGLSLKYSLQLRIWLHSHNICRRFINESELDKKKNFDAFISYAHQDEQFVNKTLLPGLEKGPTPFRICTHERNWLAGAYIPEQIIESVEQSSRTIIVLSQHFIESDWARMEFRMAHQSSLIEGRPRLVIIKYGEIVKSNLLDRELRAYLSMTTYLDWKDERFWHKLRYAMPHKKGEARDADMLETGRKYVIGEMELNGPCTARN